LYEIQRATRAGFHAAEHVPSANPDFMTTMIVMMSGGWHGCGRSNVPPILPTMDVCGTWLESDDAENQNMNAENMDNLSVME
jgi:hypothetical protein